MKCQILAFFIIATLLTGCVNTKKITSVVQPKFQYSESNSQNDSIVFNYAGLGVNASPVVSTRVKLQLIPALVYWQWNNTIKCEIDPKLVGQLFQESVLNYADDLKLREKLQGRTLEITVEKIPNNFAYTYKGFTIIVMVAYYINAIEMILPQEQNLVVSYKLTKNGETIKTNKITVTNNDKPIKNNWGTTKKFTGWYVDQFKQNITLMSEKVAETIAIEM